ncbi:MAG TPA: F0F1 ATP synthase subunit epsilon [Bryobacteraceae bacterium]|nr:F0F1 ATP synthase subunit epsilon [Bryobacteraceae bacterium]
MKLTVWLPSEVLLEEEVVRIQAQAENGWFGILPKHADTVTALVPSVLIWQRPGKPEEYLAVDHGILVKCGPDVRVSTRNAVRGASLEQLKDQVEKQFRQREELEKKARAFEAKLETDLVRRLLEEEKRG